MSKKLSRYLEDIEKTEKRMAELKAHLDAVRQSQKADEDAEIVKSIRSMNVKGWDLIKLLESIQNGAVELRPVEKNGDTDEKTASTAGLPDQEQEPERAKEKMAAQASESEDNHEGEN